MSEFYRLVPRSALLGESLAREIAADQDERRALAARFGLATLERLEARVTIERTDTDNLVRVSGRLEAAFSEVCVVSLAPLPRRLSERFTVLYSLLPGDPTPEAEVWVDPDQDDPPEPIPKAGLDLGEAVIQQLALFLDPYARAEDAVLECRSWGDGGQPSEAPPEGPFAGLKSWRR